MISNLPFSLRVVVVTEPVATVKLPVTIESPSESSTFKSEAVSKLNCNKLPVPVNESSSFNVTVINTSTSSAPAAITALILLNSNSVVLISASKVWPPIFKTAESTISSTLTLEIVPEWVKTKSSIVTSSESPTEILAL